MSQEIQLNHNLVGIKFLEVQNANESVESNISGEIIDEDILQTTTIYNVIINDYCNLLEDYKGLLSDNLAVTQTSVESFVQAEEQMSISTNDPIRIR
ncbi:DUF5344 family protein [Oceanobacillus sp. 1P07AA]|uniref:DUF5344 family protein n=1 Tax=Oceanobacillus sp. 1P07AA TaxID=3132293 RepID=UPI0039A76913